MSQPKSQMEKRSRADWRSKTEDSKKQKCQSEKKKSSSEVFFFFNGDKNFIKALQMNDEREEKRELSFEAAVLQIFTIRHYWCRTWWQWFRWTEACVAIATTTWCITLNYGKHWRNSPFKKRQKKNSIQMSLKVIMLTWSWAYFKFLKINYLTDTEPKIRKTHVSLGAVWSNKNDFINFTKVNRNSDIIVFKKSC